MTPEVETARTVDVTREVDLTAFAAVHAAGAVVIDVREPVEYVAGHVPGAILVPLSRLPDHIGSLPRDSATYLICASGNRSLAAVDFLARQGITAYSVAGGTAGWARSGGPIVTGIRPTND